jgi:hypothetical protein
MQVALHSVWSAYAARQGAKLNGEAKHFRSLEFTKSDIPLVADRVIALPCNNMSALGA